MKGKGVVHSSNSDEWETPQDLYDALNKEFRFQVDAAATKENSKCGDYWSKESNALFQEWDYFRIWCNPPYSQWQKFVAKAAESTNLSVLLLPSRTDTKAFHAHIYKNPRVEIRFIKGRLKFGDSKNSAPFPSMIVIFNKKVGVGEK